MAEENWLLQERNLKSGCCYELEVTEAVRMELGFQVYAMDG